MKTSCPACGAAFSLDALVSHDGARTAIFIALQFPVPIGKLMIQYIGLFRPEKRQLAFSRVADLMTELLPMISEAKIERNGRIWSAPQDYWAMALNEMLAKRDKLTLPLKTHGYLLAIIEGYSSKAEAKQETQREASRAGQTPIGAPSPQPSPGGRGSETKPRSRMPAAEMKAIIRQPSSQPSPEGGRGNREVQSIIPGGNDGHS